MCTYVVMCLHVGMYISVYTYMYMYFIVFYLYRPLELCGLDLFFAFEVPANLRAKQRLLLGVRDASQRLECSSCSGTIC